MEKAGEYTVALFTWRLNEAFYVICLDKPEQDQTGHDPTMEQSGVVDDKYISSKVAEND